MANKMNEKFFNVVKNLKQGSVEMTHWSQEVTINFYCEVDSFPLEGKKENTNGEKTYFEDKLHLTEFRKPDEWFVEYKMDMKEFYKLENNEVFKIKFMTENKGLVMRDPKKFKVERKRDGKGRFTKGYELIEKFD